ncbi:Ran-binding protein 9/10 [Microdochium nivale]|nr:Ran-binding protein 9/10 [Microdochium nivale]
MPDDYMPPPGPPPSYSSGKQQSDDYAPPPGPPPSSALNELASNNPFRPSSRQQPLPQQQHEEQYAPPPGPPPQHDWQSAVPDTSLLPPPPAFFTSFEFSPTNNASGDECALGEQWCARFPLYRPTAGLDGAAQAALAMGNINLMAPPAFRGSLTNAGVGLWRVETRGNASDTCLATYPPLYTPSQAPSEANPRKRIYYEVNIARNNKPEVDLALGYTAPPYPAFRLPGWHRGSLGVHGDDGSRFVNDNKGGQAFVRPFQPGDTVGLGVDFTRGAGGRGIQVVIFFTRNGALENQWNLYEERDNEQDAPLEGLQGYHDLCAAIGLFEQVKFEAVFAPGMWKWQGFHTQAL